MDLYELINEAKQNIEAENHKNSFYDQIKTLFNTDDIKIQNLGFSNKKEFVDFIIDSGITPMQNYWNSVISYNLEIDKAKAEMGDDRQYMQTIIMEKDKARKISHDHAIDACNIINRICDKVEQKQIIDVDTNDRFAVNEFIYNAMTSIYVEDSIYRERREELYGKNFDDLYYNHKGYAHETDLGIDNIKKIEDQML